MSPSPTIRVVKVGGSLLDLPDLAARLHRWRAETPATHDVWIVGGGQPVDALRARYAADSMAEHTAHWLAIKLMAENAQSLSDDLVDVPLCKFARLGKRLKKPDTTTLDVLDFMRNVEPHAAGRKLPASWDVTSDSIAGRMAIVLGANELVLLKSTTIDRCDNVSMEDLARSGIIDAFLPDLASELPPVTLVNFRCNPVRWAVCRRSPPPGLPLPPSNPFGSLPKRCGL